MPDPITLSTAPFLYSFTATKLSEDDSAGFHVRWRYHAYDNRDLVALDVEHLFTTENIDDTYMSTTLPAAVEAKYLASGYVT